MKVSHAPWIAECVGSTGGENPDDVYELNNGYRRLAEYLSEADAKLCAAAPDLLAALRTICDSGVRLADPLERQMLEAIKKAEGK